MKKLGVYVHVPFCRKKCPYCDFYSIIPNKEATNSYMKAIFSDIQSYAGRELAADTVYFGGGTPTRLPVKDLIQILGWVRKSFPYSNEMEVSVEANPDSVNAPMLQALRNGGFNRLSFGLQSSIEHELKILGRSHSKAELEQAVAWAREAGFSNISVDIMLGIPEQSLESLGQTIDFLKKLDIQHVSAYMLKVEKGTPFYGNPPILEACPDEDLTADLYLIAVKWLEAAGFMQYEISNFAKKKGKCQHNLKYWSMEEYIGIGPSAHSFLDGKRFAHKRDLQSYCKGSSLYVTDANSGAFEEYGMLRLRLTEGLNLQEAAKIFNIEPAKMLKKASPLKSAGFLSMEGDTISLTANGFLLSNAIIAQLLF